MAKDKNTSPLSAEQENTRPPEHLEQPEALQAPAVESLHVLADRHRVPGWQAAALAQGMGWQDGKQVSNADYMAALEALKNRRIGGGRME